MAERMNMMRVIKRAVSPKTQRPMQGETTMSPISRTPLTDFICPRLEGAQLQLFAVIFAEAIKKDRHAKVVPFENVYKFLGYDRYDNAVRQLKRLFRDSELVIKNLLTSEEVSKGARGPAKQGILVSVRQFETMMLAAKTEEGAVAREMMLDVKDAVQDYMKMEMENAAKAIAEKERLAQEELTLKDNRLQELEGLQTQLQATIEAQKKREEKKEARKKQQKEPLETAYLMTNNADSQQGPFKSGCTARDPRKRAKGMQTGNHEELKVVASVKCMDAELVEKVMHRIFHDYRTNDKLEWFDTNLKSMDSVMRFVARIIDGLNCVDHDEFRIEEALKDVTELMEDKIFMPSQSTMVVEDVDSSDGYRQEETVPATASARRLSLNPIDEWLVKRLETNTLPRIFLAQPLEMQINADMRCQYNTHQIGKALEAYEGKGVHHAGKSMRYNGMRGIPYHFDALRLSDTLVKLNKMTPLAVEDHLI